MYHREHGSSRVALLLTAPDKELRVPRPRRGSPEHTRDRLVAAAAALFNRLGYHRVDSNRIAKEAGYATGTFYKHFQDKREIFLAAYETWVSAEWNAVARELSTKAAPGLIARQLVTLSIQAHTRWKGLRASLLELVFADPVVRRFYRQQRRRQLDLMAELRERVGAPPRTREEDAIHLFTTERTYDAVAQGELEALGLSRAQIVEAMTKNVLSMLK
jgi:AcrR family transcriptional regulator